MCGSPDLRGHRVQDTTVLLVTPSSSLYLQFCANQTLTDADIAIRCQSTGCVWRIEEMKVARSEFHQIIVSVLTPGVNRVSMSDKFVLLILT